MAPVSAALQVAELAELRARLAARERRVGELEARQLQLLNGALLVQ